MAADKESGTRRLSVIQGGSSSGTYWEDHKSLTFILEGEDHTLGNALRHIIMRNSDVEFCGYNVPHPTESRINFRIQSRDTPAVEILKKGLLDLSKVCEHVQYTFEQSVKEFKANSETKMETD